MGKGDGPLFTWRDKKRPRPYRAPRLPAQLEWKLQQAIVRDILDPYLKPSWRYTHPASGEKRDQATAGKLKGMGVKRGVPDLCFWSPSGLGHFLELKRDPTEQLQPEQLDFQKWCIAHGIPHRVAWSIDMAWAALEDFGCLKIKRVGAGLREL